MTGNRGLSACRSTPRRVRAAANALVHSSPETRPPTGLRPAPFPAPPPNQGPALDTTDPGNRYSRDASGAVRNLEHGGPIQRAVAAFACRTRAAALAAGRRAEQSHRLDDERQPPSNLRQAGIKTLGNGSFDKYGTLHEIEAEVRDLERLMARCGRRRIDVSYMSVEEVAKEIVAPIR